MEGRGEQLARQLLADWFAYNIEGRKRDFSGKHLAKWTKIKMLATEFVIDVDRQLPFLGWMEIIYGLAFGLAVRLSRSEANHLFIH